MLDTRDNRKVSEQNDKLLDLFEVLVDQANEEGVRKVFAAKPNLFQHIKWGLPCRLSPIVRAVKSCNLTIVKMVLAHCDNKCFNDDFVRNEDYDRRSAMHHAVLSGDIEIVDLLLSVGFCAGQYAVYYKGIPDADGWQPLHHAANRGRIDIAEALIRAGAEVAPESKAGETPLDMAVKKGDATFISAMKRFIELDRQSLRRRVTAGDLKGVEVALANGYSVNGEKHCLNPPIYEAIYHGHFEIVRMLIEHGADMTIPDLFNQNVSDILKDEFSKYCINERMVALLRKNM